MRSNSTPQVSKRTQRMVAPIAMPATLSRSRRPGPSRPSGIPSIMPPWLLTSAMVAVNSLMSVLTRTMNRVGHLSSRLGIPTPTFLPRSCTDMFKKR